MSRWWRWSVSRSPSAISSAPSPPRLGSFALRNGSGVSRLSQEMAALIGLADAMIHPNLKTFIGMIEPGDREKFCEALELAKIGTAIRISKSP